MRPGVCVSACVRAVCTFFREQRDTDCAAGKHQCPKATSVSPPLVSPALPPTCPGLIRRVWSPKLCCAHVSPCLSPWDNSTATQRRRNSAASGQLKCHGSANFGFSPAENTDKRGNATSASSTKTRPLPPQMERTCAANCEQREILMTSTRSTATSKKGLLNKSQRRGAPARRSSTMATPQTRTHAREENRREGQLHRQTQNTQDTHSGPQSYPQSPRQGRLAQYCEKRWAHNENGQPRPQATVLPVHGTDHKVEEATVSIPHGFTSPRRSRCPRW